MKRYIRTNDVDMSAQIEQVALDRFKSSSPGTGCTFIAPDGSFVNIYPGLSVHEDLCEWVEDELSVELEYRDEEYFIREYQWVRLRNDPNMVIIELPKEGLFKNQWYSLEDWLLFVEEKHLSRPCVLYIGVCDDAAATDVEYKFCRDYFADDILAICKRYFSSGRLVAKEEI